MNDVDFLLIGPLFLLEKGAAQGILLEPQATQTTVVISSPLWLRKLLLEEQKK